MQTRHYRADAAVMFLGMTILRRRECRWRIDSVRGSKLGEFAAERHHFQGRLLTGTGSGPEPPGLYPGSLHRRECSPSRGRLLRIHDIVSGRKLRRCEERSRKAKWRRPEVHRDQWCEHRQEAPAARPIIGFSLPNTTGPEATRWLRQRGRRHRLPTTNGSSRTGLPAPRPGLF